MALQQRALAKLRHGIQGTKLRNFRRGRYHIFGWAAITRWTSAHILVYFNFSVAIEGSDFTTDIDGL